MKVKFTTWVMMVLVPFISWSQQVITFTDGTKVTAFITYQTRDTVKYYLEANPKVIHVQTTDHIRWISSPEKTITAFPAAVDGGRPLTASDSLRRLYCNMEIQRSRQKILGGSMMVFNGMVGIFWGSMVLHDQGYEDEFNTAKSISVVTLVVASISVISGIALLTSGSHDLRAAKNKMKDFSLDLRVTPEVKEVMVVYRF